MKVQTFKLLVIMEVRLLSEEEEWALGECKNGLSELDAHHMKDLWQKSRSKWASYGDDNTKYFHGIINVKNSRDRIHGVDVNGQWIQNPRINKREVRKVFKQRFTEDCSDRPPLYVPTSSN
ncbi:hypothetical protein QVD17_22294 [Tagetes erecta]|uniref:Uncharacterized protein n=1 Tax=Tagetes erecta TaxID=13708 RepID=A0AAD8KD96_TARER|nr:hypothetical protein QVD17_22294 [Tagetes erecta]